MVFKKLRKKIKELDEKRQPKQQEETETIETNKTEEEKQEIKEQQKPKEQPLTFGAEAAQVYNLQVQILATLQEMLREMKRE